jgi:hypothetical protein
MNWKTWARIEPVLSAYNIKPILAVVPDNHDQKLMVEPAQLHFWDKVRAWQEKGWSIALHGYQHMYETQDSGLVGLNNYSEFAGLPYEAQRKKLVSALSVFSDHNIRPDAWIAPAHAFDEITVMVLLELGVRVISDGFSYRPVRRLGALWIPQQLWKFQHMYYGVWTVCYHHNNFTEVDLELFEREVERFSSSIVSINDVIHSNAKDFNLIDVAFSFFWLLRLRLKEKVKHWLKRCKLI